MVKWRFPLKERQRAPKNHDWSQYQGPLCGYQLQHWCYSARLGLYFSCSSTRSVCTKSGGTRDLNASLYETILPTIDYTQYQNKATIIKVVLKKPVPTVLTFCNSPFTALCQKHYVWSMLCSTFNKKKNRITFKLKRWKITVYIFISTNYY
jgi:hypothetical protein